MPAQGNPPYGGTLAAALVAELPEHALRQLADALAPYLDRPPATPWLSVPEAAAYLRASKQRVYDLIHAGALEPARDGRRVLLRREQLDAYLEGASR